MTTDGEDTGETGKPETAPEAETLWALWREISGYFSILAMFRSFLFSRTFFGLYGVDLITGLRAMPAARRALARLESVSDGQLEGLISLAEVNAQRNTAMWRLAVISYVSIPVTLVLIGLEAAPELIRRIVETGPEAWLWSGIATITLFLIYYFMTQWRGGQITAVLEIAQVERAAAKRPVSPAPGS